MTALFAHPLQLILGFLMLLSSLGVLLAPKPVHACLSFLLTLMILALFYLQLSASFIGVMQILVYAGAILVTFMFVMVLFQDAHYQIDKNPAQSSPMLLFVAAATVVLALLTFGWAEIDLPVAMAKASRPMPFGSVEELGKALYLDFFFPFEAVILLFLVAIVGAFYIGRKGE